MHDLIKAFLLMRLYLEVDRTIDQLKLVVVKSCFECPERQMVFEGLFVLVVQIVDLFEPLDWNHEGFRLFLHWPR